jgi:hypothetical protein
MGKNARCDTGNNNADLKPLEVLQLLEKAKGIAW